ncbi:MAG: hypothetical protein GX794_03030 [Acholeplasmataceae bacterium]|nr:hypothetical protein [Acholeplasmataceae bacterium]
MRHIVYDVDMDNNVFYIILGSKKQAFYLTKNLSKTFGDYIKRGYLIDFEIVNKFKKIGQTKAIQVHHFTKIKSLNPEYTYYDLSLLKVKMAEVVKKYNYYLFLDFEMTMPGYKKGPFQTEIIQFGAYLVNKKREVILTRDYYIEPINTDGINKRTKKFLSIDEVEFFQTAKKYRYFYDDLKELMTTYNPIIVTWGKNDRMVLKNSYKLNNLKQITRDRQFIDLLQLHKDYFNLKNDLGLFNAHMQYYPNQYLEQQTHDAKDDALVMMEVFFGFMEIMDKENNQIK